VDEYQDTNYVQHRIMCLLTRQHSRICVVGDDAQSIYGFRGARIDNILQFNEQYPETRLFKLEQNYRSTQTIVQTANSLIRKNKNQIRKEVFSLNGLGERIPVIQAHSDIEEAIIVSKHIHDIHRNEKVPYSGFAILYRTNAQSRVFEESFRREALPYRIYGGVSFYQRKEIKDAIAYFRMVLNPNDEEAFKRTINYPSRGIGATTLGKIVDRANANSTSLWQVLERPMEMGLEVNKGTLAKLRKFHDLVASWHEIVDERDAFQLGKQILSESGIIADLGGDKSPEGLSRQENVNELLNGLNNFVNSAREEGNGEVGLRDFLAEVSLISDLDTDDGDSEEKITLMTVHSAKGLEFDTVFIVGMERDLFPNAMSSNSLSELEEERRLFYVALTRAKRHCVITHAKSRFRYGQTEWCNPSPFLRDLDVKYLDIQNGDAFKRAAIPSHSSFGLGTSPNRFVMDEDGKPHIIPRTANPVKPVVISKPQREYSCQPVSTKEGPLQVGNVIEHERFGIGDVIAVTGSGENVKATVKFRHAGEKQLLLKFARFKIIE
ncbi:MAG: UvrD-helicase domain-containing protein, partial [Bacteroidaceae bacterium]|nr:UvrD-helicase domain-containing protein [Bacteroidaceae bacterium]